MGIRVQPLDIDIPPEDPFTKDLLGRREPVEILTNILRSIEGPCVLAVDGAWGAGKTTFLRILAQYLRNHHFPIIQFNAWKTDFSGDPFLTLCQELNAGLNECSPGSLPSTLDDMKSAATEVLRKALPGTVRIATAGILDLSPLIEKEAGQALASYAQARLDGYLEAKKSLGAFKASLGQLATELADANGARPLVVVIDELDRCRPSYAVELLETAKHFFTVHHVVFVLAINRSQLAHSIRAVYGSEFDAHAYLRRFFDIDFRLPEAERRSFVEATLAASGIDDYCHGRSEGDLHTVLKQWLPAFFDAFDVSLRSIAQAIHHLGLVFASLRHDRRSLAAAVTLALIMRTLDFDQYRRFARGELKDREAVQWLFSGRMASIDKIRGYLEAVVIVAAMDVRYPEDHYLRREPSPYLRELQESAKRASGGNSAESDGHALWVVNAVDSLEAERMAHDRGLGFNEAVRRLDLVSTSLVVSDSP